MDKSNTAVWMNQSSLSFDEFKTCVNRKTNPHDLPLADDITSNVPIYDCRKVLNSRNDSEKLQRYMAEWNLVFREGAGIVIYRNAYEDLQLIDDVTAVLNSIIEQERSAGTSAGDHFAPSGANSRIWNAHEKLCMASPELFARYNANAIVPLAGQSWLGPMYQITAQVNVVRPGGQAQISHRDYHLGFQSARSLAQFPSNVHALSASLTLQGAIAHTDMPVESGPTKYLPFSQTWLPGYLAATLPEYREYFESNYVQLSLNKGDAIFFNPAVSHAAGENRTNDIQRMANLIQMGSAFGRSIEIVDRKRVCATLFPILMSLLTNGTLDETDANNIISAAAEGYPFPANLDMDSPVSGLSPMSQQDLMRQALNELWTSDKFTQQLEAQAARQKTH